MCFVDGYQFEKFRSIAATDDAESLLHDFKRRKR